MACNQLIFKTGDLFNSYKEFEDKLKLYNSSTGYNFNTLNSSTLSSAKAGEEVNEDLIYDGKYLKCEINPKTNALKAFTKEHPEITVKLCPAHLVLRVTKNKQQLKITKFHPEHDHDFSDKKRRLDKYKKQTANLPNNNAIDSVIVSIWVLPPYHCSFINR
ncbi:uncharacterized protein LOC141534716 [Cotesia typhae]|uniref:uncharacterized protein LOC141534716 n=1 Tax=Cotesia typhae TaxID=2053667 RepID=UPI003D69EE5F